MRSSVGEHLSDSLRENGWLSVKQRIQRRILVLVHEALLGRSAVFISRLLVPSESLLSLQSADQCLLHVPRVRNEYGRKAFSVTAPTIWNQLPLNICSADALPCFLTLLDEFLLR